MNASRKRVGVLALLSALLGAAALFFGLGAAEATTPCTNSPSDTTVNVMGLASYGISTGSGGSPSWDNVWVCATPPGTATEVNVTDPNSGTPGKVVYSRHCDAHLTSCTTLADWTGAEVSPIVSPNAPGGATAGTGGWVGTAGTCAYVDGSATCVSGGPVADLTVNEGDAVVTTTYNNNGPWVTAGGPGGVGVQLPYGFGVMVGRGTNSSADTVNGHVGGESVTQDVGGCYVSYNTDSTTCS